MRQAAKRLSARFLRNKTVNRNKLRQNTASTGNHHFLQHRWIFAVACDDWSEQVVHSEPRHRIRELWKIDQRV